MAKVTYEFSLPEDDHQEMIVRNAIRFYRGLCEIDNLCRRQMKHGDISEETYKILDEIRQESNFVLDLDSEC